MSDESKTNRKTTFEAGVPAIIQAAGDSAVAAYVDFFSQGKWRPNTRKIYGQNARRFFRWADARGLNLQSITASDIAAYANEVSRSISPHQATVCVTPVRGVIRHLIHGGVVSAGRFESMMTPNPNSRNAKTRLSGENEPWQFSFLSLMAMLSNMEEKSREVIFTDDTTAEELLKFLRWRDCRSCTHCGTADEKLSAIDEDKSPPYRCASCGNVYTVTDGSPFEDSIVPLKDGLFFLFTVYLSDDPQPGAVTLSRGRGIDEAAVVRQLLRLQEALDRDGLESGEELRRAIAKKDREMTQDEVVRDILDYVTLESHMKELLKAKTDGTPIDGGLPPDMTLDGAIDIITARLAEHDRYKIWMKDGYLAYHPAETSDPKTAESEPASS